jgi:hypothetical protein
VAVQEVRLDVLKLATVYFVLESDSFKFDWNGSTRTMVNDRLN